MRRWTADHKLAAGMALFSLVYMYAAWKLPRFVMTTVVDAHVFPMVVGGFLFVLSILLWFEAGSGLLGPIVYSWAGFDLKALLIHVVLVFGYILALEPLGFAISTTAYMVLAVYFMGYRRTVVNWVVAVLFSAGAYYLFNHLLNVPLPTGVLGFLGL